VLFLNDVGGGFNLRGGSDRFCGVEIDPRPASTIDAFGSGFDFSNGVMGAWKSARIF
jgi:hypothetical protein